MPRDLGLIAVSCGGGLTDIVNPNPNRVTALASLARQCELFAAFGIDRIVTPLRTLSACRRRPAP